MGDDARGADRRSVLVGAGALAALAVAGKAVAASDSPVAETTNGQVRGEVSAGINVFRGIPYGAPTGGDARFQAPQPPPHWGGVREARSFGPQCPQLPAAPSPYFAGWQTNTGENEDCLVLNVWTPGVADGKQRPVMVWFHGGGYDQFSGSTPVYDGTRLATRGDVVVVTLNHRLNLFGYLYLADLANGRFPDSGNVGQLDLIAALGWVQGNIAAFGGDPGRVTIFGESGGGGKVSTLLAMPAARGLFHRAIIQSGPGLVGLAPDAATATARALCAAVNAGPGDLPHLSPDRLLDGLAKLAKDPSHRFGPVVDGRNLPRDPFTPDAPRDSADVPVIVGYNATESTLFSGPPDFSLDWPGLKAALAPALAGDVDKLIADFRGLRPDATASDLYFAITTDAAFGRGSITLAERKAALGPAPAYLYRLEFQTPVGQLRTPHSLDLPLVFDNVAKAPGLLGAADADAQKVADQMSAAWIAFAHTGSPNATGLASWPRYDIRARSTMLFNVISRAVNDPHSAERQLIAALPAPPHLGV